MIYAQISAGRKMHIVYEPGEEYRGEIIRYGRISNPLCGQPVPAKGFRMTCNWPLGHACKKCRKLAQQ